MISKRRTLFAATAAAVVMLAGCSTPDEAPSTPTSSNSSESTSPTPEPTPTPLTAAETAQEAVRLWVADPAATPERRDDVCELFAPEAIRFGTTTADTDVPMAKWCGASSTELLPEPGHEVKGRVPTIEEQTAAPDGSPWVRVELTNAEFQYVVALAEVEAGWQITGWCSYGASQSLRDVEGGEDPFHCLRSAS